MDCNMEEAIKAMKIAEKKLEISDFIGAKKMAQAAHRLFPSLENITQLLTVCEIHCSAQNRIYGTENDWYGILQIDQSADETIIKKQYRKLALLLHPDKNKFAGAEAAFKLVGEANRLLSDQSKRMLYDRKYGAARRNIAPSKSSHDQRNGFNNQASGAANGYSSGGNSYIPSQPQPQQAFWTCCPFCNVRYQYLKCYLNTMLRCQNCGGGFIPRDLSSETMPRTSHQANIPQKKAGASKSAAQNKHSSDKKSRDRSAGVDLNANAGKKQKAQQVDVEDRQGGNVKPKPNAATSTKKPPTKSENRKRQRKSADLKEKMNNSSVCHGTVDGDAKGIKHELKPNTDLKGVHVLVCSDPEFSDFDKDKVEACFAVNQVWAIYDIIDGMPRFYARIRKVFSPEFKLQFTWFEPNPDDKDEIEWSDAELPVACGKYTIGETEVTADLPMFSHLVHCPKRGGFKNSFFMHPRKGETWAVFKDWDIKWSSNPEKHTAFVYQFVEILGDYDDDVGISIAFMDKVKGFVCLFQTTEKHRLNSINIPPNELYRFSHQIPSVRMTGKEGEGVPKGSFELDPAALPPNINDHGYQNGVSTQKESSAVRENGGTESVKKHGKIGVERETMILRRSPRNLG
ncbi:uncharacterized protein LOC111467857 [Cucurbita maxima]|uniref:Uncharacterized protein LOC111467857 n=1 Tax=Cucurbita maxima TaxID=3661 RepID=A0A6J1I0E3_CUCMA|nr:uncharacterized protein LOC111467857 [Cucurbita maxima]XP_022968695.1 uncharacterized protein LOC111467857 [Cucurbita maxima]XP_022968696.1 uncharacterized protein LOC111467857 [Cucurbita maxima]